MVQHMQVLTVDWKAVSDVYTVRPCGHVCIMLAGKCCLCMEYVEQGECGCCRGETVGLLGVSYRE